MSDIQEQLQDITNDYSGAVRKIIAEVTLQCAKECNTEIKRSVKFQNRTGTYLKSFTISKAGYDAFGNVNAYVWHSKNQYQLTHLLEKGHKKRNGGMTRAFPHISKGAEYVNENLPKMIEQALEGIK